MALVTTLFTSNPLTLDGNLAAAAAELRGLDAAAIIEWGLRRAQAPVVTTNFRPGAAVLLHLVTQARPGIPVVWIDTGYNTPATYRYAETLRERLGLELHCYTPALSRARQAALRGDTPRPEDRDFAAFARAMKLEPFERAFDALRPDVWFTGVRAEQNAFRRELGVVSRGARNTLRLAPLHTWTAADLADHLLRHGLPDNDDYVDPTKPAPHLECGLQRLA
ncbi:MAG: phosphoadenosine phosphosulfate reductase family protein [Gammaproteobacteria bacterium]